jgi:hypothetical protein
MSTETIEIEISSWRHSTGSIHNQPATLAYISKYICGMYTSAHPEKALSLRALTGRYSWHIAASLTHETASRLNTPEIFNRYRSSIGEELP